MTDHGPKKTRDHYVRNPQAGNIAKRGGVLMAVLEMEGLLDTLQFCSRELSEGSKKVNKDHTILS